MPEKARVEDKPKNIMPKPSAERIELKKRKTSFTKTYLNTDGSFSVEVSGKPMNFNNKSGNLKDIDNTIVTKVTGGYEYENLANSITVRFAKNNQNDKLVYYALNEEHWIAFSPTEHFTEIGNPMDSGIYYKGIRQNIDLEYILDGTTLKENIILFPYPSSNSISFDISYGGVWLEQQKDGSIAALDIQSKEPVFSLNQPIAIDANGKTTDIVSMNIVKDLIKERLIVTVDYEWLMQANFPVIIDPEINVDVQYADIDKQVVSNISDTFLSSGRPTANYLGTYPNIHAGYIDADYETARGLIRFDYMPALPPGAKITNAFISMYMWSEVVQNSINVYRITSNWTESSATWDNPPAYDAASPVATNFSAAAQSTWNINITNDVNDWYKGIRANYGFFIKASNENAPRLGFYSSNSSASTPKIIITYKIDALGVEPFLPYHGNVNVHNGNLVLSDVDVTLPGRGIPIVVSRTYNSRDVLIKQ